MKRLFAILSILVLLPIYGFAISLEELQSNPSKYVKTSNSKTQTFYVDITSIKSLRSDPPYYTLQADIYQVDYDKLIIFKSNGSINYDYSRSSYSLFPEIQKKHPENNLAEDFSMVEKELMDDCGIYFHLIGDIYKFNGTYLRQIDLGSQKAPFKSQGYVIGDFIFEQYYNRPFSVPEFAFGVPDLLKD